MKKYVRLAIYFVLFAALIGAFIYLGKKDFDTDNNLSDAERFSLEYNNISKNNKFQYAYCSEVVDIIKNKTGVIFIGFSSNDWAKYYINYLNEVVNESDFKTIYYYNLLKDRARYTKYYRELEDLLSDYLYELDSGSVRLSTPALIFVKNGKIMFFDDETAVERKNMTADYYWNEERVQDFKNRISSYLKEVDFNE